MENEDIPVWLKALDKMKTNKLTACWPLGVAVLFNRFCNIGLAWFVFGYTMATLIEYFLWMHVLAKQENEIEIHQNFSSSKQVQ